MRIHSPTHVLERLQVIPAPLERVFPFFEDPLNLEAITPPWLRFNVVCATDRPVRVGTEIEYRLRWQVFPMRWRSRIAEHTPGVMFADEMLVGPYRRWYHRHHFREVDGGVEMRDVVEYRLPFGPLGSFVHSLMVRDQLEEIFDFRATAIRARWASPAPFGPAPLRS